MISRLADFIHGAVEYPRVSADLHRLREQRWKESVAETQLRADLAAARSRLSVAPHPDATIVGCWTLGGHDAALAAAAGESGLALDLQAPPTVTLRDLGAMDAARVHAAKGCGRGALSMAALTLRLAGVVADPSWSRWLR